jgi:hypothetical protein
MVSTHLYSPSNPRRPIDWRWQRAMLAASGEAPLARRGGDRWVARAMAFQLELEAATQAGDLAELVERESAIFWAHDIWSAGAGEYQGNPFRSELEARLLASDQFRNIADRLNMTTQSVEAYERLFFNVIDRRLNRGYLVHQVLGPAVHTGFQVQDYDLVWKLMALLGGPLAVDLMVDHSVGHAYPERHGELKHFVADITTNDLRRSAMMALKTLRINNFNAMEVVDKFLKLLEIERTTSGGSGGVQSESLKQSLQAAMVSMPFSVGKSPLPVDSPGLAQYDTQGTELRIEELMAVLVGQDFPASRLAGQLVFPPPPALAASKDGEGGDG